MYRYRLRPLPVHDRPYSPLAQRDLVLRSRRRLPQLSESRAKKRSQEAPKRLAKLSSSFSLHQGGGMRDLMNMAQAPALREKILCPLTVTRSPLLAVPPDFSG